jgi:hypothetical protein
MNEILEIVAKTYNYVLRRINDINNDIEKLKSIKEELVKGRFDYDTLQYLKRVEEEIDVRKEVLKRYYAELENIENNNIFKAITMKAETIINGGNV